MRTDLASSRRRPILRCAPESGDIFESKAFSEIAMRATEHSPRARKAERSAFVERGLAT